MPPRIPPKAYHILLKTHKLTVFLTVSPSTTVVTLKDEALSALTSTVLSNVPDMTEEDGQDVPRVESVEDFELCRGVKDKGKPNGTLYEPLDPSVPIKGLLSNWETLYVQFKDGDGKLLPVNVSQPSLCEEEEESRSRTPLVQEPPAAVNKGKRKARD